MFAIHELPWARVVLVMAALTASSTPPAHAAASAAAVPAPAYTSWHGRPIRHVERGLVRSLAQHDADTVLLQRGAGTRSAHGSRRVRTLQRRLRQLGYRPGPVDGRMGPRTEGALRWFEFKHSFPPDGVVWPRVWTALRQRTTNPSTARDGQPSRTHRASAAPHPARRALTRHAATPATRNTATLAAVVASLALTGTLTGLGALLLVSRQRRTHDDHATQTTITANTPNTTEATDEERQRLADPPAHERPDPPRRQRLIGYVTLDRDQARGSDGADELKRRSAELDAAAGPSTLLCVVHDTEPEHGRVSDRPGLAYALDQLATGHADGLIALELHSITHSILDLEPLVRWFGDHDKTLVVADVDLDTSTETGRTVAHALATVSASQRARTGARTRKGLDAARTAANAPAAVRDVPELHDRITAMRARGMTLQAIADTLNREGVPTLRGGTEWRPSSVQSAAGYKRPGSLHVLPNRPERDGREPL